MLYFCNIFIRFLHMYIFTIINVAQSAPQLFLVDRLKWPFYAAAFIPRFICLYRLNRSLFSCIKICLPS